VHPGKNLGSVVEQLPAFQQIELVVVGDGEQRLDLSNRAETLGVADRIRWLGWQSKENLPQLYREADALVHPSLYEGSPNVVLEAMASGIPTVASDTPGNRSVVRDGENGLLYSLSDPLGLRNALVRLTTDRELALQLGANGRRLALAHHSWTRAAQSYLEYLSQS
jgi:glycosyltransferase involved in cell wall biosynthesis